MSDSSTVLDSDSEQGRTQGKTDYLVKENSELSKKNKTLTTENRVLKNQLGEVSSLQLKMQETAEEKIQLVKKCNSLQAENRELAQKLEIIIQRNAEMEEQFKSERVNVSSFTTAKTEKLESEIKRLKTDNAKLKSQSVRKQNELKDEIDQRDTRIKQLESQLENICSAASERFSKPLNSFDELLEYLVKKPREPVVIETSKPVVVEEKPTPEKVYMRKAQKAMDKLERHHEKELTAMKQEMTVKEGVWSQNMTELELANSQQRDQITALIQAKNDLANQNAVLSGKLETIQRQFPDQSAEISKLRKKKDSLKNNNKILKQQLSSTMSRISSLETGKTTDKTRMKGYEQEIIDLKDDIVKQKQTNSELSEDLSKMAFENESLKKQLESLKVKSRKQETKMCIQQREIDQRKAAFEQSEEIINQQGKELRALMSERKHLISLLRMQNSIQVELEARLSVKPEPPAPVVIVEKAEREPKAADPVIPASAFCIDTIPSEVAKFVKGITENSTLRPHAKVKQTITLLCQHYNEEIMQLQSEVRRVKFESKQQLGDYERFIESFHAAFPEVDFDITNGQTGTQMGHILKETKMATQRALIQLDAKDKQLTDLLLALDCGTTDEGLACIDHMKRKFVTLAKKVKEGKKHAKSVKKEHDSEITKAQDQLRIAEQTHDIEISKRDAEITDLKQTIDGLHKALISLPKQQDTESITSEPPIIPAPVVQPDLETEEKLKAKQKELRKLRHMYDILKLQGQNKSAKIRELKQQLTETAKNYRERCATQQEAASERYENTMELLKARNLEYQNNIDQLNSTISALESENNNLQIQNANVCTRLRKSEMSIDSLRAELERERQIISSRAKAESIAREVDLQTKIQELRAQIDKTKKDLMSFVGVQFCSLFDLSEKMTEETFEDFVRKVRDEFEKLLAADRNVRKLLSIGPNQSIEDEISKMLLK